MKDLVVTAVAQAERFATLGIRISYEKLKVPVNVRVMILCWVMILKYPRYALRLGS